MADFTKEELFTIWTVTEILGVDATNELVLPKLQIYKNNDWEDWSPIGVFTLVSLITNPDAQQEETFNRLQEASLERRQFAYDAIRETVREAVYNSAVLFELSE